ncbi:hypothetical protein [Haloarchaeobius salinus]|uniref:hypothetical protein n=1 Tax=Haloarchaeobius salinus TaxID=1198298 RepID=UPI00210DC9EC|nr:hypothetical protein [Haloarchaeobius salinus]
MGLKRLVPLVLRYTLVGGVLCTTLVLGGAAVVLTAMGTGSVVDAVANVALVSTLVGFGVGVLAFSTNNSGIDTVEAGIQGGFDVTDPTSFRADSAGLPGRLQLGFLLLGAGLFSGGLLAVVLTLG